MKLLNQNVAQGLNLPIIRGNVYGIEIELEGYNGFWNWFRGYPGKDYWNLVPDPSLREGIELVSKPLTQPTIRLALTVAQKAIDKQGLIASSRCGVHVHVNMLNVTWGQMWSFIALYTFLEPEIFARFAPERHENHFCVPMYWNTKFAGQLGIDATLMRSFNVGDLPNTELQSRYKKKSLQQMSEEIDSGMPSTAEYGPPPGKYRWYPVKKYLGALRGSKYGALTTYRMADLGTVELRLLPGTTNMEDIQDWVKLLGRMKFMANKYKEPLNLQKYYESEGPSAIWRELKMGARPHVKTEDKDDAEENGFKIIGSPHTKKEDLKWNSPI